MDRFVLTDFSSQSLQVIFAEDKWTALVETFMVVTKANGALARTRLEWRCSYEWESERSDPQL